MRESFAGALVFTLHHEGGADGSPHVDPNDEGGSTRWGIAQRYHPDVKVLELTREQAAEIYHREYWVPNGCDDLRFPRDVLVFDSAVNPGAGASRSWHYQARSDAEYIMLRVQYYVRKVLNDRSKERYLKGWLARCVDLFATYVA
jgi:lysozyme family protein